MAQVLTIVPTASSIVLSALVSHFPHKRHRVHSQRVFLMNMLRAMVYVPGIRAPALAAIVNRLVDIDVSHPTYDMCDNAVKGTKAMSQVMSMMMDTMRMLNGD